MKRLRILHIAEAAGGVERYLETLFKYSSNNVENILVCSQNYDYKKFKLLADRVIVLQMSHDINLSSDIKVEITLRKIIKKLNPDIIYAHSSKAGALARIADLGIRNEVVYNPHGWAFNMQQSKNKKILYKWVERILAHFCNKIICISDAEKESALREKICKLDKLQVIYNGIDVTAIEKVRSINQSDINIPKNAYVIGMVGRLTKQKAPDIFVRSTKMIKEKIPNAYFLMVGSGELLGQVKQLIHEFKLDSCFTITGWVENPTAYMKIMDVGMLLSRWEGFGLVLPEYMICNVPVIATNVDAIPNIISNWKNGILVAPDSPKDVVEKVLKLYTNQKLQEKIVKQGKLDAQTRFNGARVSYKTEKMYYTLK